MIEGILTAKNGKKYRVYMSADIRKKHTDFEHIIGLTERGGSYPYLVWEEIKEKEEGK